MEELSFKCERIEGVDIAEDQNGVANVFMMIALGQLPEDGSQSEAGVEVGITGDELRAMSSALQAFDGAATRPEIAIDDENLTVMGISGFVEVKTLEAGEVRVNHRTMNLQATGGVKAEDGSWQFKDNIYLLQNEIEALVEMMDAEEADVEYDDGWEGETEEDGEGEE